MVDVDHGFYYVKFDLQADRETVIGGGPWMIFDHYVAVACWTPEFVAPTAKVDRTMVWIRFPGLNMVYYDESFLLGLASCVGRPIKVDSNTLRAERGRYARVCVEIDLTKPVVGRYFLGGHCYKVVYEGLHVICKSCGCYGHVTRNCPIAPVVPPVPTTGVADEQGGGSTVIHGPDSLNVKSPIEQRSALQPVQQLMDNYGDWLIVTRKKKFPKKNLGVPTFQGVPKATSGENLKVAHVEKKTSNQKRQRFELKDLSPLYPQATTSQKGKINFKGDSNMEATSTMVLPLDGDVNSKHLLHLNQNSNIIESNDAILVNTSSFPHDEDMINDSSIHDISHETKNTSIDC
ncbi:unnamed protein product [Lupinus luteus]|uniref:CCHC-type domain-containing protein n=1 Tax=Lupinus luteus TaxID=3873 RepID=A0AAV1XCJ7_LUPLU